MYVCMYVNVVYCWFYVHSKKEFSVTYTLVSSTLHSLLSKVELNPQDGISEYVLPSMLSLTLLKSEKDLFCK